MDLFSQKLDEIKNLGNYRFLRCFSHNGLFLSNSKKQKILNFASNSYLGLDNEKISKKLKKQFLKNLDSENYHFSSASSRLLSGNFKIFEDFENLLSELFGKSALLFNSGYHANVGAIESLSKLGKICFLVDEFSHASIFDGLKQGRAFFKRFSHNDMAHLRTLLESNVQNFEQTIIISEALFSMDGDFAPLAELVALKREFGAHLYLDEAHSIGVIGSSGLGLAHFLGLQDEVDFLVLAFGKAINSVGAAILCSQNAKDFFINTARSLIFSTALPPLNVAYSNFIFQNLARFEKQRLHLQKISKYFKSELEKMNFHNLDSEILGQAHIVSWVLGDYVQNVSKMLEIANIFAPCIRTPSVRAGCERIRFSLRADMKKKHINHLLCVLDDINFMG